MSIPEVWPTPRDLAMFDSYKQYLKSLTYAELRKHLIEAMNFTRRAELRLVYHFFTMLYGVSYYADIFKEDPGPEWWERNRLLISGNMLFKDFMGKFV